MGYGMNNSQSPQTPYSGLQEKIPSGYKKATLQNYTPQQMQLHESQFAHLRPDSYLSRLASGDQSFFDEMEAPAMRQFQQLQGGLASRFSGMGSTGARNSSGFQNTGSQAASNFAQDLQSKRQDYMRQALNDLMGLSNTILGQQPFEQKLVQKQQKSSGWGGIGGAALGGLGGFFTGGPGGALSGAKLGYDVGSQF
jgi:hypothetical protein